MIKRLIFDVDNTLITNVDFKPAVEKTLEKLGIYSEKNVSNFFNGISTYESLYSSYNFVDYKKHLEECMNLKLSDNFLDIFFEYLKDAIPEKNEKLNNTIYNLSKKYELSLLTNYFSISQFNRLNKMGIGKYFNEAYGEEIIKPNKEAYIKACGPNKPEECVMIGDSVNLDIDCAKKAGLNTIFVNTKKIPVDNLNTIVVDKVENITEEVINKINI